MAGRKRREVPAAVARVRERLDVWRRTRERRGPMPEDLWDAAVGVAQKHGVWAVSRALRVNYATLGRRVEVAKAAAPEAAEAGAPRAGRFVEVDAARLLAPAAAPRVMVVEVTGKDGAKLTVRVEGVELPDVPALVESFWRRAR